MLVTDGVPGDLTPIIEKHNLLNNGSSIPVRIFTYLIGVEVTNIEELRAMACENRGTYVKAIFVFYFIYPKNIKKL